MDGHPGFGVFVQPGLEGLYDPTWGIIGRVRLPIGLKDDGDIHRRGGGGGGRASLHLLAGQGEGTLESLPDIGTTIGTDGREASFGSLTTTGGHGGRFQGDSGFIIKQYQCQLILWAKEFDLSSH